MFIALMSTRRRRRRRRRQPLDRLFTSGHSQSSIAVGCRRVVGRYHRSAAHNGRR